jgi:hypothetical protein
MAGPESILWVMLAVVAAFVLYVVWTRNVEPHQKRDLCIDAVSTFRGLPELEQEGRFSTVTHKEDLNPYETKFYLDYGRDCVTLSEDDYEPIKKRQAMAGADMEPPLWRVSRSRQEIVRREIEDLLALDGEVVVDTYIDEHGRTVTKTVKDGELKDYKISLLVRKLAKAVEERDQTVMQYKQSLVKGNELLERNLQLQINMDTEVEQHVNRLTRIAAAKETEDKPTWGGKPK